MAAAVTLDHVHLFVSAPPKLAPAQIVRWFKGMISRRLTEEFQAIRRAYREPNATLWAEGYNVGTVGHISAEALRRHIEDCQMS